MLKRVYIVRHGQTTNNLEGRLMNWHTKCGLTDEGAREAAVVANRLRSYAIDTIYASDLQRTVETAKIISDMLTMRFETTSLLRERDLGNFGGLTFDEIKSKWPNHFEKFIDHSDKDWNGFAGESINQVCARFNAFLHHAENQNHENILLVTHSGIAYIVLRDVFGFLPQDSWLDIAHTSITILKKTISSYELELFNSVD